MTLLVLKDAEVSSDQIERFASFYIDASRCDRARSPPSSVMELVVHVGQECMLQTSPAEGTVMPKAWTNKDERQYEHIKESASKKGRSSKRAKAIAAATVNKKRSQEGRTKSKKRSSKKK